MVLSCLVEPLVTPLIGGGAGGNRRSALQGTRLVSTALACSALMAIAGGARAEAIAKLADAKAAAQVQARAKQAETNVVRNAHQKPKALSYRTLLATVFATRRDDEIVIRMPGEAPAFEQDALDAHRKRHRRDIVRDQSPSLGHGVRTDRLFGGTIATYLHFGSGRYLSGQPRLA